MRAASFWTTDRISQLEAMASSKTGTEIAQALGVTRNAVLGAAHRHGIKLCSPRGSRDFSAMGRMSRGRKGTKVPLGHPSRRARPARCAAYSLKERAGAVAAVLAGASYNTAASLVGASKVTVDKLWRRDPEVLAKAQEIFERAHREASARMEARRRLLSLQTETVMAHNRRVLAGWGERNRTMVLRKCAGETLAVIGSDYGLTRERVRQILVRAIQQGILAPPGVNLQNDRASA